MVRLSKTAIFNTTKAKIPFRYQLFSFSDAGYNDFVSLVKIYRLVFLLQTSVEATPVYLINITSTAPTAAISNKGDETTSTLGMVAT